MQAQKVFISAIGVTLIMLQIQNQLILARVALNSFNLPYIIDALQTIKQMFFRTKSNSESVCFTLMTSLTMTSFSMTRAVFVNYNMPRIVDNNISYLKLTIYRQLLCWNLIARHLNINTNIPHRPEVKRIGAPTLPKH